MNWMSRLRESLIKVQKEETLKELLKDKYHITPEDEKQRLLALLGDTIERDVDKMIREEIDAYNENTPIRKKNKKLSLFIGIINVILTILISYAVNECNC